MVDLRIQLVDAGMALSDQAFYSYFNESLPPSLDLFVTLYEDGGDAIDLASTPGSFSIQDGDGISTEWCEWHGHYRCPGLDARAACVAVTLVHSPPKEGRGRANEYLGRVHIDIVGHMPVKSDGGKEYEYVVVADYTRTVYPRPIAAQVGGSQVVHESGINLREVMTDNARELSMREVRDICERDGIKLVP